MPIASRTDETPRLVAQLLSYLAGDLPTDPETRRKIDEHIGALHRLLNPDEPRRMLAEARSEVAQIFGNAEIGDDDAALDRKCLVALSAVGFRASLRAPVPEAITLEAICEARRDPDEGTVLSWLEMRAVCEGPLKAAGVLLGRLVGKLRYLPVRGPAFEVGASARSVIEHAKLFSDPEPEPMTHPPVPAFASFLKVMRVPPEPYTAKFLEAGREEWASMAGIDDEGNHVGPAARDQ